MSEDPLVLLVLGFLLTGVLGTALAYVFQQRAWRHQYRQQREDLLRDQALKTFEEISTLLDRRLYRMRRVAWEAKRGPGRTRGVPGSPRLSPALTTRLTAAGIGRRTRRTGDGSDHDPAWVDLDL